MSLPSSLPQYVLDLVEIYGPPKQRAWGTAVFYDRLEPENASAGEDGLEDGLETVALRQYQYFANAADWSTKPHWRNTWQCIYQRPVGVPADFFRDLRDATRAGGVDYDDHLLDRLEIAIVFDDQTDSRSVQPNPRTAAVLSAAFDAPEVQDFRVYRIGDSEVLQGLWMAARRGNGEVVMLAFIHD
ncbi:hypothetical protein GFS31_09730 [Leptolyngbya sp. BL0902]|uniref:hypothetical protein n=1 Tax=Leptolyngbya sp. BL0902 TaxID=1115757 RepID=UPI0018E85544|nr:hypothetical protein [Leptolyngbya sp. BL0902]QQE64293.1 hypothetical protein GFS31_09730 [Leptolyngbya sp. BL0902]